MLFNQQITKMLIFVVDGSEVVKQTYCNDHFKSSEDLSFKTKRNDYYLRIKHILLDLFIENIFLRYKLFYLQIDGSCCTFTVIGCSYFVECTSLQLAYTTVCLWGACLRRVLHPGVRACRIIICSISSGR